MTFKTRYDRTKKVTLNQKGEKSKTRQSEADSCDINKIMERFNRTGQLPRMQSLPPQYGDARIVDYQTAMQIVKDSNDAFMQLPATTRRHFGDSPQNFMSALQDPSDDMKKQLLKLGVLVERKPDEKELLNAIAKNTSKDVKPQADNKA